MIWFYSVAINQHITHLNGYSQINEHNEHKFYCITYVPTHFSHLSCHNKSVTQCRCNCVFATKLGRWTILHPPHSPSCVQISYLLAECSCSCFSQNKTSQSVGQKFRGKLKFTRRARLPPLTHPETTKPHLHTCSSTSILSQRERTHDSDLLIYQFLQLNPKMMWVQMDGDPRPRQPGGTSWQSAWDEERNKERRKRTSFHQVRVESQLLACWWVSQNSELLSWEKPATVCWTRTANELPSHTQSCLCSRNINFKCGTEGKQLSHVRRASRLHRKCGAINQNMSTKWWCCWTGLLTASWSLFSGSKAIFLLFFCFFQK